MDRTQVMEAASKASFEKPLINNVQRGIVAEAIVHLLLDDGWKWCSEDWSLWDFEHIDGTKLEVKQSAARQSWHTKDTDRTKCEFDIAARKKEWRDNRWVSAPGRKANLYVFAYHPIVDESADHCNPHQWLFYVVPERALPNTKKIRQTVLEKLTEAVNIDQFAEKVDAVRHEFQLSERE
ncbi:hypothetical protein [uncultured Cohaesibacter sp.]|uniref:hypothetical protein n=1 Tax=uncultured Cohaesibacter sp. TaxID=1002546 RepID=UPI00292E966A|nr:hypothetical protein [uncultured Cohaesibacter sp.]